MTDFTKKKMGKKTGRGFGKVETFGNGDVFKASRKGGCSGNDEDPNMAYYKRMQKYLKQSTTGSTTYRDDFCGMSKRKMDLKFLYLYLRLSKCAIPFFHCTPKLRGCPLIPT